MNKDRIKRIMDELQGDQNATEEQLPTTRTSKLGRLDPQQQRRRQERDDEYRRQLKQQMKAAAIVKLEAALSSVIPSSLNKGILDVMTTVTTPLYRRVEKVDREMKAL